MVTTERIRSNGHKLKHRKFSLNVWGKKNYHEGEVQEPFAQKDCGVPILGDVPNVSGHSPEDQVALPEQGGWTT